MDKSNLTDISWLLNSLGILKENETIVGFVDCAILIERKTEKGFSYRIADPDNLKTYHLMSRKERLPSDRYSALTSYTKKYGCFNEPLDLIRKTSDERAEKLLEEIFRQSLPKYGMNYRKQQEELSQAMLKTLHSELIALCEAEVGTGKTHAYILALAIHNRFKRTVKGSVVATSTVALQKAITEEYIPSISTLLKAEKVIDKDLNFVVRKGKSHYVCENRLQCFKTILKEDEQQSELSCKLDELGESNIVDLDDLEFSAHVKSKICVLRCKKECKYFSYCRYQRFLERSRKGLYDYQIVNHNYLLADILQRNRSDRALLGDFSSIIIDEAHKLPESIRAMYGVNFKSTEIDDIVRRAEVFIGQNRKLTNRTVILRDELFKIFIERKKYNDYQKYNNLIIGKINELQFNLNKYYKLEELYKSNERKIVYNLLNDINKLRLKLNSFKNFDDCIIWVDGDKSKEVTITSLSKRLNEKITNDLWDLGIPIIMTSGTISVNGDFTHLINNLGIDRTDRNIIEFTSESPFDYVKNGLLYLPKNMPIPRNKDDEYVRVIVDEIRNIIKATHGHTLVLFTSYNLMEKTFYETMKKDIAFPLFMMSRKQLFKLTEFKKSKNGVMFASDSCGEGIDLAGDIVSSVIVVRLPFPIPSARHEYELMQSNDFEQYLSDEIIPTMIIKLRQWIGRGIRRETDTCVFSILDPRASDRYKNDILKALPPMPVTEELCDVEKFIKSVKNKNYFE
ncbi:MAG: ATP-dependent DNA helicase [Eubacteriales bacterium]